MPRFFYLLVAIGMPLVLNSNTVTAQKAATPPKTSVRGTLVSKTDASFQVQVDGEERQRNFYLVLPGNVLDPKAAAFAGNLPVGSLIEVTWATEKGLNRITNLFVMQTPGSFGLRTGTVVAKTAQSIDITDEKGKTDKYVPTRDAAGFFPDILAAIAVRNIGDRVEIRWVQDEGLRVSTMRLLELSADAANPPGGEGGMIVGHVVDRGTDWVSIKTDGGTTAHYLPQRIAGDKDEFDKDVLRTIAAARRGTRVEGRWFRDGEKRLYVLKPVTTAPKKAAKP